MAAGTGDRTPYWAAVRLLANGRQHWNLLDGRILLNGGPGGAGSLDLRQLINVTYVFLVEWMSKEERAAFDKELPLAPGKKASTGTNQLMAAFGMPQQ